MFFVGGLVSLGAVYVSTGSEDLQFLTLLALMFGVFPAVSRRFGRHAAAAAVLDRVPPVRVQALAGVFWLAWGALVLLVVPDPGLGGWWWFWLVLWPGVEVYDYLSDRSLRRDGVGRWKPFRLFWSSAGWGLAVVPVLVVMSLLDEASLGEAVATGIACGGIVFAIGMSVSWLVARANEAATPARSADMDPDK